MRAGPMARRRFLEDHMNRFVRLSPLFALALAGACATIPAGPSVMAMPGTGKSFDHFRADDADCRQYAASQVGVTADQTAIDSGVRSAAVGTIVGALAGAAVGGHTGAGVGAGTGLIVGSVAGAGAAQSSGYSLQRRYDNAYVQCMYAKGDKVPVSGRFSAAQDAPASPPPRYRPAPPPPRVYAPRPPQAYVIPPPPPGNPPPPPPGVAY